MLIASGQITETKLQQYKVAEEERKKIQDEAFLKMKEEQKRAQEELMHQMEEERDALLEREREKMKQLGFGFLPNTYEINDAISCSCRNAIVPFAISQNIILH